MSKQTLLRNPRGDCVSLKFIH